MKTLCLVLGGGLALLNAGVLFSPPANGASWVHGVSAAAGLILIIGAFRQKRPAAAPVPAVVPTPAPAAPPPAPRAEAEVVALLALLQEKGRLVDFVREDIAGASDEQVGAAARVVHAGCQQVLTEYFEIAPVRTEAEGTKVTLPVGYDASAHRLLGSVPAQPPYTGTLLHPGWAVRSVRLPRVTGTSAARPWPVLAPAEVELPKS